MPSTTMAPQTDIGLPANIDAEKTILGAILLDNQAFYASVESGLIADDFMLDSHRRIFRRIAGLMDAGQSVDIITLAQELGVHREMAAIGGAAYLAGLTDGLPRRPSIGDYLRIVRDKAMLRRLMEISTQAIERASDQSESALEVFGDVQQQIIDATARVRTTGKAVIEIIADEANAFEQEADAPQGQLRGASLLTDEIDRATCGMDGEELCLLAGRPSSGKTEGGLQVALKNARRGQRVHIQSLEMTRRTLLRRLWRLIARVPVAAMRDPRCLTPEQRRAIRYAQEELADLQIFIDDTHELTIAEYRSRAVLAAKRWKADLIVIDYAQLLIVPRAKTIIEAAPKQAETLRHVARDYCRTLALAQIRRAPPNDLNLYPDVEMILGSSAFEQAAQIILLLHRTREEKKYTGEDYCFLGKMRELQTLQPFGIRAEKWGEFVDRYDETTRKANSWYEKED